jgi:hypothetical protein
MKPLHYLSKVFGLASFCLCKKCGKERDIFLNSGAWWSRSWVVIYALHLSLQINVIVHDTEIPVKIIISHILYYLSLYLMNIISLCLCNNFNRRQIPKFIDTIEDVRNICVTKVDTYVVYKRMGRFVLFETIVLLLVNSVMIIMYLYFVHNPSILNRFVSTFETLVLCPRGGFNPQSPTEHGCG